MGLDIEQTKHVKLALRRGMLELDILLNRFFEEKYAALSTEDKQDFVRLLATPDPELFAWLMGQTNPQDESLILIVEKIRKV